MTRRSLNTLAAAIAAVFFSCGLAIADCPPSCAITGGSDPASDCLAELAATGMHVNYPAFNPAKPKPAKEVRCFDGDAGCDLDGEPNGECLFDIDVCLRNADPALPSCTPADVTAVTVSGASKSPQLAALQTAIDALLPATTNLCTTGQELPVPLKTSSSGAVKRGKGTLKFTAEGGALQDKNGVKLSCVPRNWPSQAYNHKNHRSTPVDTAVDATNVDELVLKWHFGIPDPVSASASRGVTATPTLDERNVYVTSWNGLVYAVDRRSGKQKWSYDTESSGFLGVQQSATLTADGRVLVGDSAAKVHCLSAKKGDVLWTAQVGDPDGDSAHIWGSPTVINDKVIVGIASHSDQPCTRGETVALDLDTGAELWRAATVPAGVCHVDTNIACTTDAECANAGSPCVINVCSNDISQPCVDDEDCPGQFGFNGTCITTQSCFFDTGTSCTVATDCPSCIPAVGGGVTTTVATDETGDSVFTASVGCFTSPSVGNSDAMFSLDASDGSVNWVYRTRAVEQFADGPPYHDYGFLNGPILAEVDDGLGGTQKLVVAGSKDGTIYAVDRDTGAPVWSNELIPAPDFAGFGLFNGPQAFADGNFYAALFAVDGWPGGNDHLYSFNGTTGATEWSEQIGASWSATTVANGVLYAGTQAEQEFYAYNAATGMLLRTFVLQSLNALPDNVSGGAAIVGDTVYIPYGVFGNKGGVLAYGLPTE
jgi:polyvinyl alcohol dehydrogenase (cytochrome)